MQKSFLSQKFCHLQAIAIYYVAMHVATYMYIYQKFIDTYVIDILKH